jgi:hypothetical protein
MFDVARATVLDDSHETQKYTTLTSSLYFSCFERMFGYCFFSRLLMVIHQGWLLSVFLLGSFYLTCNLSSYRLSFFRFIGIILGYFQGRFCYTFMTQEYLLFIFYFNVVGRSA